MDMYLQLEDRYAEIQKLKVGHQRRLGELLTHKQQEQTARRLAELQEQQVLPLERLVRSMQMQLCRVISEDTVDRDALSGVQLNCGL